MMSYAAAVDVLVRLSGMTRTEVERVPTDALWAASGHLIEARDVIEEAKQQRRQTR